MIFKKSATKKNMQFFKSEVTQDKPALEEKNLLETYPALPIMSREQSLAEITESIKLDTKSSEETINDEKSMNKIPKVHI